MSWKNIILGLWSKNLQTNQNGGFFNVPLYFDVPTIESKAPFHTSPDIVGSELRLWDIEFTTKKLTYYKNKMPKQS